MLFLTIQQAVAAELVQLRVRGAESARDAPTDHDAVFGVVGFGVGWKVIDPVPSPLYPMYTG